MTRKWPFRFPDEWLDRPVNELRAEHGLVILNVDQRETGVPRRVVSTDTLGDAPVQCSMLPAQRLKGHPDEAMPTPTGAWGLHVVRLVAAAGRHRLTAHATASGPNHGSGGWSDRSLAPFPGKVEAAKVAVLAFRLSGDWRN